MNTYYIENGECKLWLLDYSPSEVERLCKSYAAYELVVREREIEAAKLKNKIKLWFQRLPWRLRVMWLRVRGIRKQSLKKFGPKVKTNVRRMHSLYGR
jgi:hypothetical protein